MSNTLTYHLEKIFIHPLVGSLFVYLIACILLFLAYKWNKKWDLFIAKIFAVTACWAAGIALSASLGENRWFVVVMLLSLVACLFVVDQKSKRRKVKKISESN